MDTIIKVNVEIRPLGSLTYTTVQAPEASLEGAATVKPPYLFPTATVSEQPEQCDNSILL